MWVVGVVPALLGMGGLGVDPHCPLPAVPLRWVICCSISSHSVAFYIYCYTISTPHYPVLMQMELRLQEPIWAGAIGTGTNSSSDLLFFGPLLFHYLYRLPLMEELHYTTFFYSVAVITFYYQLFAAIAIPGIRCC